MSFEDILKERVLVLDGAMGTMIQRYNLEEDDFRSERFAALPGVLKGCNDLLCLTRPDVISAIHDAYLQAGADIVETDTFNANAISLGDYGLADIVEEINLAGARLAREAVTRHMERTGRRAFVAGSVGPSNVSLSMPSAPGEVAGSDFTSMAKACEEQVKALIDGGVDFILLETIFDTLNAKAAVYGIEEAFSKTGKRLPLMISVTLTQQGRTLSGQTVDAFIASIEHARPLSVGLNCGFGAAEMRQWLERLQTAPWFVSLHPNAGLPDEMGRYCETSEEMAAVVGDYLDKGWLNIVGGCCGTTPDHIAAIARRAAEARPRVVPDHTGHLLASGLELLDVDAHGFLKVGERCNVAGSRKFLRLIGEGAHAEAVEIAAGQIAKGAGMLDINMDDGMLDSGDEMERFVTLLGLDPATAVAPVMIDSSDFSVIERALRKVQGRSVVNSISLKEGEDKFLEHARELRRLGAAVVVMAFDEKGQATTFERRVEICSRAYRLLTEKGGLRGEEIIFDPNILTVATGMPEHDRYALDFLDATEWIKKNLPGAKVSGGVSNLSFAFRGNNKLREAMHTVFLHHAIERGMDMAIVNPSTKTDIATVDPSLRAAIEDVIFCRDAEASSRLTEIAGRMMEEALAAKNAKSGAPTRVNKPDTPAVMTLQEMVMAGRGDHLEERLEEALREDGSAMTVIKSRLMEGMNRVGEAFSAGRMFLPQVVRSAGVMKQAIAWLTPYIESESSQQGASSSASNETAHKTGDKTGNKIMVLATVKGDVHDIGKNIVAVVLRCSGFEVHDLGVMVPCADIMAKVKETGATFVGLSGLITPSLSEMAEVASALEEAGMTDVNLFVGGATTSALHTAVKIAPLFSGSVFHTLDAATLPDVASRVADPATSESAIEGNLETQRRLREEYEAKRGASAPGQVADMPKSVPAEHPMPTPAVIGVTDYEISIPDVEELINWRAFLHVWGLMTTGTTPEKEVEKKRVLADAHAVLDEVRSAGISIKGRVALLPAHREGLDIVITPLTEGDGCGCPGCDKAHEVRVPTIRQSRGAGYAAADFLAESGDWIGLFAVTVGKEYNKLAEDENDEYRRLILQALGDRLVEGATEWLHGRVHVDLWGLGDLKRGPRPAIGYPSFPDQTLTHVVAPLLDYDSMGITVTDNGALSPSSTTTGFIFASPRARYFDIGEIDEESVADYARRRGLSLDRVKALLRK